MTLDNILKILDRDEAVRVAQCGKNAAWHWYKEDHRRKVPGMPILVAWADHLELSDADLGELIRDAQQVRIRIFELLAQEDKRRIKPRSTLRKELAREIAEELEAMRQLELEEKQRLVEKKEEALRRETQEQVVESERQDRLEQIRDKLKHLRRKHGDY
tara:strand:+ start:1605 stop:2081 length:477 start_codon:yes stop_codon:yes gene_type:complete